MSYNFKPLQFDPLIPVCDPGLALGDGNLLFHRIYAVQIRQEQSPLSPFSNDDAVALYIQFIRRADRLRVSQHIDADLQPLKFPGFDRIKARIPC